MIKKIETPIENIDKKAMEELRKKNEIETIEDVSNGGTHQCVFYENKGDLIDILVPYFTEGLLKEKEYCIWVCSDILTVKNAKRSLRTAVGNLNDYIRGGQMEILNARQWYAKSGQFDVERVLQAWANKEKEAIKKGFKGLRITGDPSWVATKYGWEKLIDYERRANDIIFSRRITAICSYSLGACRGPEILEAASVHQSAVIRRKGEWNVINSFEQKKLESFLQNATEKYGNLSRNIEELVYVIDSKTFDASYINGAILEIYGYSENECVSNPKLWCEILYPEDRERIIPQLNDLMREGNSAVLEYRIVAKNNQIKWIKNHAQCLKNENGKTVLLQCVCSDITKYKDAIDALRQAENRYKLLLENVPQNIYLKDKNSVYISCNKNYARDLKINTEEIYGKTDYDFFPKELADKYRNDDKEVIESGEAIQCEEQYVIGKQNFIINSIKSPVEYEQGKFGILGIFHDITGRRKMEDALHETSEFNSTLFEYNPIETLVVDTEGRITMFNRAKRESGDRLPKIGDLMYRDYADKHEIDMHAELMNSIKSGQLRKFPELKYKDKFLSVTISPFHGGAIITSLDITEQKKGEQNLKRYYEKLQEYDEKLVCTEKLAYVGRIAANIAHEVRNPLTNVVLSTRQLAKKLKLESSAAGYIEVITRNVDRVNYLITELLNCARPPALKLRYYNIHKIINEAVGLVRGQIRVAKIKISKRFTPERSRIRIDKEQMKRVLINIICNAVEAIPKKGGKISIATESMGDFFTVEIRDTGKGIPEENIMRIFDPFFSSKAKGVGLGLTLCYGIMASHGGNITVQSKVNEGSIFTLVLPLLDKKMVGGRGGAYYLR